MGGPLRFGIVDQQWIHLPAPNVRQERYSAGSRTSSKACINGGVRGGEGKDRFSAETD